MDRGNSNEAMREIELDIEEGADIITIKPALFYVAIMIQMNKGADRNFLVRPFVRG